MATTRTTGTRRKDESTLLAKIRLAIGSRDDVRILRINTGVFRGITNSKSVVRSAPNGTPDLICCWRRETRASREFNPSGQAFTPHTKNYQLVYGQFLAIETKSKDGRLSEDQKNFKASFEEVGGIYVVARSVDDVLTALQADPSDGAAPIF